MRQRLVLGIDSSTQSCKSVLLDAESGALVGVRTAPHPEGTEADPARWQDALEATARPLLPDAAGVAVAGQQHGLVGLDARGAVVRPALLWNDTRSADAARGLLDRYGPSFFDEVIGQRPDAALTVAKLAWLVENEPDNAGRIEEIALPHDWLTGRLLGRSRGLTTDVSEASGTGYFTLRHQYARGLVADLVGREVALPDVLAPNATAGRLPGGTVVGPGAADNAAAAFGLELRPGEVVVSLGTSGTVFTVDEAPRTSPGVANFADCRGRVLPLVCTLNAARVLVQAAELLSVDLPEFDRLALAAPVDADGLVFLPYLDGERYPSRPGATGLLSGLTRATMTPEHLARAATLGMLCGIADALDALVGQGPRPERVLLIGGAAQSAAVRSAAPAIWGCAVDLPEPFEYVARGAARQAAWALDGGAEPPAWGRRVVETLEPPLSDWGQEVRAAYAAVRG